MAQESSEHVQLSEGRVFVIPNKLSVNKRSLNLEVIVNQDEISIGVVAEGAFGRVETQELRWMQGGHIPMHRRRCNALPEPNDAGTTECSPRFK